YAYATALEAALKLKEVAGLWAEGFSAADLRHGPRAAALGLPALVFHAGGPLAGDVDGLERELAAAGSPIVSIGPGRALRAAEGLCEELAPIALIVPAQLVAERLAVLRGRDPDRPPGLTKVTRTH
ncbi:MAG: glutamine--fructose-6-phosphate aminotransferase, partial [Actinomycetota bacterium]|nr:glutamine--fructose-6-phosphate aminotransferase [Actinomycetota bacterium]